MWSPSLLTKEVLFGANYVDITTQSNHELRMSSPGYLAVSKMADKDKDKDSDKGTTTVIMSREQKIKEGQILLNDLDNYRPLDKPMADETAEKIKKLTTSMLTEGHTDEMTVKWLSQTPNPPRIPEFYTLTKIHKPTLVGRPIISGSDGPTERISCFVDRLIQPIAQQQESYLKDSKDFINFIENTKLPKNAILASMDVTSLYTNIPQEEGITTVCKAYEDYYKNNLPIPTKFLRQMLCLILQTHGTAMGTKMAVAFANIFMAKIEKGIIGKSKIKPLVWKRYIDDVFCLLDTNEDNIKEFVKMANHYHDTIKFTAEISDSEIAFLDTKVYKGERFNRDSTLDVQTRYKQTETFQYTNFYSCHPPGVKKGFIKGEALRLLRTNSSHSMFNKNMQSFKTRLKNRGYPNEYLEKHLFEVNFKDRKRSLENKHNSTKKKILPFVTQYHPALPNLKNILMGKWHLIQNQTHLKEIFQEPPILSYRKGKSLKDTLVRAKL